ncbi:MAG: proline--tRNA ligase, partial [Gemmatimonadetes bacterium]|nr:proline--tRNA ligase [Gemmatimonadota bacterium]
MKDAYSFDADEASMADTYQKFHDAYCAIFDRCELGYRAVEAEAGEIGGTVNHEFMVLAGTGESAILSCAACGYGAASERAESAQRDHELPDGHQLAPLEVVDTPGKTTVDEVSQLLGKPADSFVKTLLFETDGKTIAALVRGDREINESKLRRLLAVERVEMAEPDRVKEVTGAEVGFAGPHTLPDTVRIIADYSLAGHGNLVAGANQTDRHVTGLEIGRDVEPEEWADVSLAVEGDPCPQCRQPLKETRGIEVGHIFQLGTKYSVAMNATFLDESGSPVPFEMCSYGIGVTRVIAAAIEQNHDDRGIIWPVAIAPYEVEVIPLNMDSEVVVQTAEHIYDACQAADLEVLLDDRADRAGSKFADADLIGVPWRVVVGDRGVEEGVVEVASRRDAETATVAPNEVAAYLRDRIQPARHGGG